MKYELVLRKWQEFNPANEFRCFVKHNKVVGKLVHNKVVGKLVMFGPIMKITLYGE